MSVLSQLITNVTHTHTHTLMQITTYITDYHCNLAVTDIGWNWAYLSWEEPCLSNGTQYNVTCNGTTPNIKTTERTCNPTNLAPSVNKEISCNITDLTPYASYSCTVVAVSETNICSLRSHPRLLIPGRCRITVVAFVESCDIIEAP